VHNLDFQSTLHPPSNNNNNNNKQYDLKNKSFVLKVRRWNPIPTSPTFTQFEFRHISVADSLNQQHKLDYIITLFVGLAFYFAYQDKEGLLLFRFIIEL
jgi:hypothetical protein